MVSKSPQEYRERAEECERLAAIAANVEVRQTLLYLAKRWREFEGQAEWARRQLGIGSPQYPSK